MRLIHVTDPHLSSLAQFSFAGVRGKRRSGYLSWYRNRRYIHRRDILDQLVQAAMADCPDQILLTGDLVHIGLEDEMIQAGNWLRTLGSPAQVTLIPGNHDVYAPDSQAAMIRHWGDYLPAGENREQDPAAGYPFTRDIGDVRIVGLSTACVTRIFSARGTLGAQQRLRLAETLACARERPGLTCLLLHHPPLPGMAKRRKALTDARELEAVLNSQPPELLLYGHIHHNREHRLGETRIFGTASASAVETASYRIFDVERNSRGWGIRMRLKSISGDSADGFPVVSEQSWDLTS